MATYYTIAKDSARNDINLLSAMANRHGLITGATGTGKTVTLQKLAENFSFDGVPVFMADIKGDLSGIATKGESQSKLQSRLENIGVTDWHPDCSPVEFWDLFGQSGHPVRATIEDLGAQLLGRLLGLNDVQAGVLQLIFKIAEDQKLPLIDLKDIRAMVQNVGLNAKHYTLQYGNISSASIGAIQRNLLTLEEQNADQFFGEPMLDIHDLMRTDASGRGIVNILAAEKLFLSPKLYSTFLLWLLTDLYKKLPEVGDLEKPKLVFFFDEAHLLFNNIPSALLEKIEQTVRLIRSKGVGVYFVSQNPTDIPDKILGQLGNRVQHALRAFTPKDQKIVKAAAQSMPTNPELNTEKLITELGVGEALISFLDEKGRPNKVERGSVIAPYSRMGLLADEERQKMIKASLFYGRYTTPIDRESAFEKIAQQMPQINNTTHPTTINTPANTNESGGLWGIFKKILFGTTGPRGGKKDGVVQQTRRKITNKMTNEVSKHIVKGIFGSLFGKRK